jgi:hypothetical protein
MDEQTRYYMRHFWLFRTHLRATMNTRHNEPNHSLGESLNLLITSCCLKGTVALVWVLLKTVRLDGAHIQYINIYCSIYSKYRRRPSVAFYVFCCVFYFFYLSKFNHTDLREMLNERPKVCWDMLGNAPTGFGRPVEQRVKGIGDSLGNALKVYLQEIFCSVFFCMYV